MVSRQGDRLHMSKQQAYVWAFKKALRVNKYEANHIQTFVKFTSTCVRLCARL